MQDFRTLARGAWRFALRDKLSEKNHAVWNLAT